MKIRMPHEWTDEERRKVALFCDNDTMVQICTILKVATSEVEERPEIEPGALCLFGDDMDRWTIVGLYYKFDKWDSDFPHAMRVTDDEPVFWRYARPIPNGYWLRDTPKPPTEADR